MTYQAQGDPTSPTTQQSYASYGYFPGAPIDGLGFSIASAQNTWPFDIWWDVWTMTATTYSTQGCTDTSHMPENQFFMNTGLFNPLDPANPTSLGMYKVWFYQRTFPPSNVSLIQTPDDAASFWNDQSAGTNINFDFGNGPAAPDPVSY